MEEKRQYSGRPPSLLHDNGVTEVIWIKEATSSTKVFGPSKEGEGGTKEKEGMISRLWHTDGGKWKMGTRHRNNLKNNLFALESVFLDFSYWIQGYRAVQRAHRALLLAVDSANEQ